MKQYSKDPLDEILRLRVSNQYLKHFFKKWHSWIHRWCFYQLFTPKAPAGLLNILISWPFGLIIRFIIRINVQLFSCLATCGWWFDGFFSHWQLAVESILQLTNSSDSTIRRRIFESGAGAVGPPLGARDPRRFRKSFDRSLNRLNSPIEGWIRRPTANGRRIHRITNHI